MNDFVDIICPSCGEAFQISIEPSDGDTEFVVDCEVCCRPMTVSIRAKEGIVENVDVSAA